MYIYRGWGGEGCTCGTQTMSFRLHVNTYSASTHALHRREHPTCHRAKEPAKAHSPQHLVHQRQRMVHFAVVGAPHRRCYRPVQIILKWCQCHLRKNISGLSLYICTYDQRILVWKKMHLAYYCVDKDFFEG